MREFPLTPVLDEVKSVDVAFTDTSAQALRFSLDHERITPLASTFIDLPSSDGAPHARLGLHVIGSSHQVILNDHTRDEFIETFACLGEGERPEWDTTRATEGTWSKFTSHRFRCSLTDVQGSFADATAEVVHQSRIHEHHLVVGFPGDPNAFTALAATRSEAGQVSWETWHCYPQHRQIVHSRSELRRRA